MDDVNTIINKGKWIECEFTEGGTPIRGTCYYKWVAVIYNHNLYIIEVDIQVVDRKERSIYTVKLVDY